MVEVVVGVDGSQQSLHALRLAAQEARSRSARLHAVYVYQPVHGSNLPAAAAVAVTGRWAASGASVMREAYRHSAEQQEEARRHAEGLLAQVIREAEDDLAGMAVERTVISDEHPSAALVRLSAGADLLVVGSRGLGGFRGLLLGSVSQQCVQHATCPVLVVRPRRRT